jgi:hypothetical protein
MVRDAGFTVSERDVFYEEGAPKVMGPIPSGSPWLRDLLRLMPDRAAGPAGVSNLASVDYLVR